MRAPKPRLRPTSLAHYALFWVASVWVRYFVTGRSLTGARTDNATMWHAATKDYRDRPYEVLTGPIWQRLARRWALLGVPLLALPLTLIGLAARAVRWAATALGHPTGLPAVAGVDWITWAVRWELAALAGVLVLAGRNAIVWARTGRTTRDFVYPAWMAATGAMGIAYHRRDARRSVQLPEGFQPPDALETDRPWYSRWVDDRVQVWRLRRETAAIAAAAELEAADGVVAEQIVSAEVAVREPGTVARFRGRLLDRQATVPGARELSIPPVRIALVPGKVSTPAAKKAFLAAVTAPLGMPDASAEWQLRGRRPYVDLRPNLLPPDVVGWEQVRRHFAAAPVGQPVIGLAAGGRPVDIDFDNNSPHVMISGGSGTGKSVLTKAALCQRMHHGTGTIMLDYKRVSHRWLHNLPGCIYAWRLPAIHEVLVAAGAELDRRLETVLPADNSVDAEMRVFPTIDVVVEEINSTTMLLNDYWREQGGQGQSPAVSALKRLVNMGREYHMHVWIMAQRASASVFGANGGDIRESFQTRLMAKWTLPTWKMLAGGAEYRRPLGGRGIWARVQDDEVQVVRAPFLSDRQARDWATSGTPCPSTPDVLPDTALVSAAPTRDPDAGPVLVTLSVARPQLPGRPLQISGLRTAAQKSDFPAPVRAGAAGRAALYDLSALVEWKIGRDGFEEVKASFDQPAFERRPSFCYALDTLDPDTGDIVVGYVGQTKRTLAEREREHRADKPWADLIVGSIRALWEGDPTAEELDALENRYIGELKPVYNVAGQKGAPWAVPVEAQIGARHLRDRAAGRSLWVPVDAYRGGVRPAEGYGAYVLGLAERSRAAFEEE